MRSLTRLAVPVAAVAMAGLFVIGLTVGTALRGPANGPEDRGPGLRTEFARVSVKGAVEVSDGTDNITVHHVYAEEAVYAVDVEGPVVPRAEIDQVVWVDPRALPDLPLAPLTRDHVLPLADIRSL